MVHVLRATGERLCESTGFKVKFPMRDFHTCFPFCCNSFPTDVCGGNFLSFGLKLRSSVLYFLSLLIHQCMTFFMVFLSVWNYLTIYIYCFNLLYCLDFPTGLEVSWEQGSPCLPHQHVSSPRQLLSELHWMRRCHAKDKTHHDHCWKLMCAWALPNWRVFRTWQTSLLRVNACN